jgi:hypothetical protein
MLLTDDDVDYTLNGNWSMRGSIIGTDVNRSTVRVDYNFGLHDVSFQNVEFFGAFPYNSMSVLASSDDSDFTNCYWGTYVALHLKAGDVTLTDCGWTQSPINNYESTEWYMCGEQDHFIDLYHSLQERDDWSHYSPEYRLPYGQGDTLVVTFNSWTFDGYEYSYEDFDFYEAGNEAYWIQGDSLVVVFRVYNPDATGILEYGNSDCTTYTATMTATNDVDLTWLYAKVDIGFATGTPKSVWFNVQSRLCGTQYGKEINSGCFKKTKPKVPDDDPPIPQE